MEARLRKSNYRLIAVLLIAQPFITMFQANIVRDIQFLGLSIFEVFNILVVGISVCITIYTFKEKKKFIKYIPYLLALGIYIVLHGMNIYVFNNEVYSLQQPSFLIETYYIVRTFIVPIMLLFSVYYSGMKKDQMINIFRAFIIIVAGSMVITNMFGIAQQNYAEELTYCNNTIFNWFSFENPFKYSYYDITTKGWFLSGNQMSAILFMTYPLTLYIAYTKKQKIDYLTALAQGLAMFMLGTKVANVGSLIILGMFLIFWIVTKIVRKPTNSILFLVIIAVVLGGIFPYSPIGHKIEYEKLNTTEESVTTTEEPIITIEESVTTTEEPIITTEEPITTTEESVTTIEEPITMLQGALSAEGDESSTFDYAGLRSDSEILIELDADNLTEAEKKFVRRYLYNWCSYFGIAEFIISHYDDLSHMEFWVHYLQETPNNDYRVLKTMILEDIYQANNNPKDKYLGMGYTLNYIYTESDYTYQIYLYGYIGFILLIGPYFIALFCLAIRVIKKLKDMFEIETMSLCVGPLLGLLVAKFSGHVFERTFPLLIIAFLLGIALEHVQEVKSEIEV